MRRRRKITVSKAEKEILAWLYEQGFRKGIDVIPQYKIDGVPMVFDFAFPRIKTLLEFQGDYFHCNPKKYPSGSLVKMAGLGNICVNYIWLRDQFKVSVVKHFLPDWTLSYLWEQDFKTKGIDNVLARLLEIHKRSL